MKKLTAVLMLFMFVSVAFASTSGDSDGAVNNPKQRICHDADGKWDPQDKGCNQGSCGCLFHEIEEFLKGLFD